MLKLCAHIYLPFCLIKEIYWAAIDAPPYWYHGFAERTIPFPKTRQSQIVLLQVSQDQKCFPHQLLLSSTITNCICFFTGQWKLWCLVQHRKHILHLSGDVPVAQALALLKDKIKHLLTSHIVLQALRRIYLAHNPISSWSKVASKKFTDHAGSRDHPR